MKNERTALIVGIIFLIIVNLFVGIWLFMDESDKPDTQASTAASDESTEGESGGVENFTEEPTTEGTFTGESATKGPTTEEPATEAPEERIEIEASFDDIRREVLKVKIGSQEGMVNCGETPSESFGPASFAVEDGAFYILDTYNSRINIYKNGKVSHIDVGNNRTRMKYQDGRFAVSSGEAEIAVYTMDGTPVKKKTFEKSSKIQGITKILLIGDTYVEFVDDNGYRYRYDWSVDKTEKLGVYKPTQEINEDIVKEHQNRMTVIGKYDQSVYYEYVDGSKDGTIAYDVLSREEGNVRWYAYIDDMSYLSNPLERFYLSADGKLYTMECFEDRTVISRLYLGEDMPTDEEPVQEYVPEESAEDEVFYSENVIEINLETNWESFRIRVKEIRKENDNYIITGDKIYGGFVILTVEQKQLLVEGAVLKLMYAGEEMERIVRCDDLSYYLAQNGGASWIRSVEGIETEILNSEELEALRTILENDPFYGEGYYLDSDLPNMKYDLVLERDVCWEVPADLTVDPECYLSWDNPNATGEWTMERFYEEAIVRDGWNCGTMEVYTEDGEIVKIYDPFSM